MRTVPSAIEYSLCSRRWTKPGDDMRRIARMLEFYSANATDPRGHS
jgi:hypothetical protein